MRREPFVLKAVVSPGHPAAALLLAVGILLCGCTPPDPGRPTPVMHNNQTCAYASLSIMSIQQNLFREKRIVDQDRDGAGEFGLLGEMAGEIVPRGSWRKKPLAEPLLSAGFKTGGANGKGFAERKGYYFRIYLAENADKTGDDRTLGGTDKVPGPPVPPEAIDQQEKHFAIYAWPVRQGTIPKYAVAFFVNEKGLIHRQAMTGYIGEENAPPAEAAYTGRAFTSEIDTVKWKSLYPQPLQE